MPKKQTHKGEAEEVQEDVPIQTSYESREVAIPPDFLRKAPWDAKPITVTPIDWSKTVLPENKERYAVILDNVLSPSECEQMLKLAEESVLDRGKDGNQFWRKALVNVGLGFEVLDPKYRNSDRIIWDNQEVMDRLWERCAQATGIREKLAAVVEPLKPSQIRKGWTTGNTWKFKCFNQRMRFLKYQGGQFFRPHCDSAYSEVKDSIVYRTHYTVHLYLNDSVAEAGEEAGLVGGATSFLSNDESRKMDVNPKAGRVLIFQHIGLYHSGDDVISGTKYTMRTDIMYELVRPE